MRPRFAQAMLQALVAVTTTMDVDKRDTRVQVTCTEHHPFRHHLLLHGSNNHPRAVIIVGINLHPQATIHPARPFLAVIITLPMVVVSHRAIISALAAGVTSYRPF